MAIGDKFKIHARWRNNALNLTAENSFAFTQTSTEVVSPPAADLVDRFRGEAEASYINLTHNTWFIESYIVTALPSNLVVYEQAIAVTAGTMTGDPLPPQVSMLISLRTSGTGKTSRGRVFIPPAAESANTSEGLVAQSQISNGLAFVAELLGMNDANASFAEWELGIWSEKEQTIAPVIVGIPRNKWATQRGRTR